MKVTWQKSCDMGYIYIQDKNEKTRCDKTVETFTKTSRSLPFILDFDAEGRLIGIEVFSASKNLPKEVLNAAEILPEQKNLSERVIKKLYPGAYEEFFKLPTVTEGGGLVTFFYEDESLIGSINKLMARHLTLNKTYCFRWYPKFDQTCSGYGFWASDKGDDKDK